MEIIDPEQKRHYESRQMDSGNDSKGRVFAGLIILIAGTLLLMRKMGIFFPAWLFSWQMLIIAIGLFIGARQGFRAGGWIIPVLIGVFLLLSDWWPDWNIKPYFWPAVMIIAGAVMILTPGNRWRKRNSYYKNQPGNVTAEEVMETVSIFGGNKKNIITKNFKGGEAVSVFGGTEINLSQADIQGQVTLEIVQVFGGTKLILPPHWQVKAELVSILGGIEDTRVGVKEQVHPDKVLVLTGVSIFGGISIKSF